MTTSTLSLIVLSLHMTIEECIEWERYNLSFTYSDTSLELELAGAFGILASAYAIAMVSPLLDVVEHIQAGLIGGV